jgi:hypothetical protein
VPEGSEAGAKASLTAKCSFDADGPDAPEPFDGDSIDVGALAEEIFGSAIDPYPRKPDARCPPQTGEEGSKKASPLRPCAWTTSRARRCAHTGRRDKPRCGRRIECGQAVKSGEADVCVSAGNTGALMAMSKFCLRTMAQIERPASPPSGRRSAARAIVLDVGATIGADAQQLIDFRSWARPWRARFSIEKPTVGLLNVGVEEIKGQEEVKEAGALSCARPTSMTITASSRATTSARAPWTSS